ncbi:hypothetical protein OJAV_G00144680 [Oryzias javanicus]|uniref:Uncharacterized protein n=1 Tax=Oryzias javanicus TaxID=123683 RepID=A0A3S2P176_ORYJA|nr:hypothetical protein OJAV_G00144680 [Oryzias javanicus]
MENHTDSAPSSFSVSQSNCISAGSVEAKAQPRLSSAPSRRLTTLHPFFLTGVLTRSGSGSELRRSVGRGEPVPYVNALVAEEEAHHTDSFGVRPSPPSASSDSSP